MSENHRRNRPTNMEKGDGESYDRMQYFISKFVKKSEWKESIDF